MHSGLKFTSCRNKMLRFDKKKLSYFTSFFENTLNLKPEVDSLNFLIRKTDFFIFKLGRFSVNSLFSYVTINQA